jgi:nitroimidazol reductase NimA-like FMN-containing flavoprotein (pyridoxamine 5'-phosphate oxidase superfamily)
MAEIPGDHVQPTARTRLRRKAERGRYDRDTIAAVLDEALIAHVGFNSSLGVCVLPMAYARVGDRLYLHGAAGNAMLKELATGADVCVTVTLVDGLVLSRSAFHHSMNYRSVVVVGRAVAVVDDTERSEALRAIVDHTVPGRSEQCRGPNPAELRATRVVALPITEASAKVRTGPPIEEPDDLALPYWGGVVPVETLFGDAVPDADVPDDAPAPSYGATRTA